MQVKKYRNKWEVSIEQKDDKYIVCMTNAKGDIEKLSIEQHYELAVIDFNSFCRRAEKKAAA